MSLSKGQHVDTMNAITIQAGGVHFVHIEPNTTGVVLEVEGRFPQRALVRFNVDGEIVEDWIDSDELLPH